MTSTSLQPWAEANQRHLTAAVERVRRALDRHAARVAGREASGPAEPEADTVQEARESISPPPALECLCATFGLSPFERDVLLCCAGLELDATFASRCAAAQGDSRRPYPTFSLALAALPQAHWSALTPAAPLRRWRLIEVGPGDSLVFSPLRIDERILHFLAGVPCWDERLSGLIEPARAAGELLLSQRELAGRIAAAWQKAAPAGDAAALPLVQLCGEDAAGKRDVAAAACAALGLQLGTLRADHFPATAADTETLLRLWEREAALSGRGLLVELDDVEADNGARTIALARFAARVEGAVFVAARQPQRIVRRSVLTFEVRRPDATEQQSVWQQALGPAAAALNGHLDVMASQFRFSPAVIRAVSAAALAEPGTAPAEPGASPAQSDRPAREATMARALWDACRAQARPRLDDLAQRTDTIATWDDLVLPEPEKETLREIALHLRQRPTVYERWGFASKSARGLGISALFVGASGTGKTMAAEVLANELRLDLYRIDLSSVVSKYIGETEKNLRRVFDAAEEGGAILLFDEADALFGKRSEVRDSHDRYANIEVSYLLQRMEAYRGLAILTTNLKEALDPAFLRRIRFLVRFPFPDAAQRAEIWRRVFPRATPTEGLDLETLSRLHIAGGHIRNVALHAAFLAAQNEEPVRMEHLLRAARREYAKLEKPLAAAEFGGWL